MSSSGAGSKTTGTWMAEADAICESAKRRIEPVADEVKALRERETNVLTLGDWIHLMRKYEVVDAREVRALEALTIPAADRNEFQSLLAATHRAFQHGAESVKALERGDYSGMRRASRENKETGSEVGAIARRIGLRGCAA